MSRINNEADRIAFNKAEKDAREAKDLLDWLRANPGVGQLNGDKFYIIKNGEQVFVCPLQEIV